MSIHTDAEPRAEGDEEGLQAPVTEEPATDSTDAGPTGDDDVVLIDNTDGFRSKWESVQIGFVDDPQLAVQDAQELLSTVVDELVDGFRRQLDETLRGDGETSTDELRYTFRRYRVLFERLLTT
jgi:hypothetical protein